MKKNFFKKLSFVLALAMIVTALAPAAGAFAAKAPKLSASTKALFLDVENKNVYDFNISNKVTGWKYLWSSSNKKVATVNSKNGVTTAVKAGKAIISVVITDKDGEEFDTLKATVYVRDNMKELTITNLPADNKLAVDATHDFNRSYVTESKRTTGSEGKVAWSVLKDGKATTDATIDANGNFVAKVAGEYTIECRAFQSSAKRAEFLKDTTKTSLVTSNVATYKVTVAPSMTAAKQTNLVKFDLTFDSAMVKADVEKNLTVSYMAGTTKVKELVKGVTMSADNKVATVEMYLNFTKGATYVIEYPNMKAVEFVSATTKVADVTDIAITTTTAELSIAKDVKVALYNKDKVDLGADPDLAARVTLEKKDNNLVVLDATAKKLYMYKVGDTVNIAATFHTYNWVDGKEVGNLTATQTITCVEQNKNQFGTLKAFTVGTSNPSNFNDPKHSFFKNTSANLYVQLLGKKTDGTDLYTNNYNSAAGTWKYTSSNTSVVMVNPTSGSMYGANEGTAVIVVYLNDVQVGACEVTVSGARKAAMAALDNTAVTVSKDINETTTVGLKVKDQLNNDYTVGTSPAVKQYAATVKPAIDNANSRKLIGNVASASATNGVVLSPYGVEAGTYYFNIEITDNNNSGVKLYANLTVTVQESGSAEISYYKVEADKTSYDLKDDSTVTLSVYGYTAGGVRKAAVAMGQVTGLEVKHTDGTNIYSSGTSIALNTIDNATYAVSGQTITVKALKATGTYTIKATTVSGSSIVSPVVFEVKNTRDKVVVTTNKLVAASDKTTVLDAINDCFDFAIGDNTGYTVDHYGVGDSSLDNYGVRFKQEGKNIYIQYVYIYEPTGVAGQFYAHKVDMGGVVISMSN